MEIELNLAGARKNINIVTTHPSQSGITGQNPGKGQMWNICIGYKKWDTNQGISPPNFLTEIPSIIRVNLG